MTADHPQNASLKSRPRIRHSINELKHHVLIFTFDSDFFIKSNFLFNKQYLFYLFILRLSNQKIGQPIVVIIYHVIVNQMKC